MTYYSPGVRIGFVLVAVVLGFGGFAYLSDAGSAFDVVIGLLGLVVAAAALWAAISGKGR